MKNILPINKQPFLHSYMHYSASMSIITNPSIYENFDLIYKSEITGFEQNQNEIISLNCEIAVEESDYQAININPMTNTKDKFVYLYNRVIGNGEFMLEIKTLKIINIASEYGIFLTNSLPSYTELYPNDSYRIFYCGAKKLRSINNDHGIDFVNNYKELRIKEYLNKMSDAVERQYINGKLLNENAINEHIEICRNALQEFPNILYLLYRLAGSLWDKMCYCKQHLRSPSE